MASNAPAIARAFLTLHRAYLQANERLASLDEALGQSDVRPGASPWDEVRDFFHYCDNYIDAVDRAAEKFADDRPADQAIRAALDAHGIELRDTEDERVVRQFDPAKRVLWLSARLRQKVSLDLTDI